MSDELGRRACDLLGAYAAATRLAPRSRARVWDRIEQTTAGSEGAVVRLPARHRTDSRRTMIWVAALAAAAAVALLVRFVVLDRLDDALDRPRPDAPSQAPYANEPRSPAGQATVPDDGERRPASPPRKATAASSAAAAEPSPSDAAAPHQPAPTRSRARRDPTASRSQDAAASTQRSDGPAPSGLAREMVLLQRARAALRADAPTDALVGLRAHAREFPDGQMAQDREVLKVEALCALDRVAEARAAARAFLEAHPTSPHAARVRDACP